MFFLNGFGRFAYIGEVEALRISVEQLTKPVTQAGQSKATGEVEGQLVKIDLDRLRVTLGACNIILQKIPGTKGGWRYFFTCPTCYRRCRLFYLRQGSWACWSCQKVHQRTLNRTKNCQYYFRQAMKEAWKVEPGYQPRKGYISTDFPSRPKYMKRKTYWEHYRRYLRLFKKGYELWLQGR